MEQQQQLLQQHNEWLRAELSKKSDELLVREEGGARDALEAANELERVKKEAAAAVRDLGGAKEEAARASASASRANEEPTSRARESARPPTRTPTRSSSPPSDSRSCTRNRRRRAGEDHRARGRPAGSEGPPPAEIKEEPRERWRRLTRPRAEAEKAAARSRRARRSPALRRARVGERKRAAGANLAADGAASGRQAGEAPPCSSPTCLRGAARGPDETEL